MGEEVLTVGSRGMQVLLFGRDDGQTLLAGQFQEALPVYKLARIVSAAMQRKDQRNGAFLGGTIDDFLRQVLIPGLKIFALLGLDAGEAIIHAGEFIDAIGRNAIDNGIAR